MSKPLVLAAVAAVAFAAPAHARPRASRPVLASATVPVLACDGPVRQDDSEVSLRRRIKDVRREDVGGAEGTTMSALVLWPKDTARRLEVIFADESQRHIALVRPAAGSRWQIAGIAVGDPLAKVIAINGGPLRFSGFDWDYGGYVSDYGHDAIEQRAGGCIVGMRLEQSPGASVPNRFEGEGQHSTAEKGVAKLAIRVSELSLAWRGPEK